ncbi:UDP-glucose 4-epimerase [Erythrobacter sp. KY5]|uniref:NAD-dependent epimerase/dehydratase family protein n=1 Tax=Erythrobacter sp. KY5 TaxID=2011159 RepID=UPI000DBF03D0|nr:NAD-dependent epimerase/dehydratase family protein [Erythrobacter sp. KY5]AWW73139.1 UDP-glucose 4-epimerase [Erythrobacter sp. KY5]
MRLLVTGASGFLGRAVVASGAEAGHHMIAASRAGSSVPGGGEVQACGDLLSGPQLDFSRVDVVIHCAARVHILKREDPARAQAAFHAMNAQLPVRLAKAAREAGVRRFMQVSSVAAIASATAPGEVLDDNSKPSPTTRYGAAKLAADTALGELVSGNFSVVSLRPPAIYGPGVGAWFAMIARAARFGVPLPIGRFDNARSIAFVGNIADAIIAGAGSHQNGSFILTDSPPISVSALYRSLTALSGWSGRVWHWPRPLVEPLARGALGDRASSLLGNAAFDGSRFARTFEWEPRINMDEALSLSFA